jgi:hypothetical protein
MDSQALEEHRTLKDDFFRMNPHSPIPQTARGTFEGLEYFDADTDLSFTVQPESTTAEPVVIGTTTGDERSYTRAATVTLPIEGEPVTLSLYSTGHPGLFLPFRDATSGKETYGAGRYLDLNLNDDGTVTIDFNYAYAPFCAYNDAYSCALPPLENWLDVPIRAGERQPSPVV